MKKLEELTAQDLTRCPVWQYTNSDEIAGETLVQSVNVIPVQSLNGRVVGIEVQLSNGQHRWALLGNVDPSNPRLTRHFITLSILDHGQWFNMARYHDLVSAKKGPGDLAAFLGMPIDAVFPVSYDISRYCAGEADALVGTIEKEPTEKLTRAELAALALP